MKRTIFLTIICALSIITCLAQTDISQKEQEQIEKEVKYYAPLRYVIVYNEIFDVTGERRMEILMGERQFNEKNLTAIFELIKKRFPAPVFLGVEVHTNLATIETPEERELWDDSEDTRFKNVMFEYKRASFSRSSDGSEAFIYVTNLKPYKQKVVVLKK
jgi:hypothetical protein